MVTKKGAFQGFFPVWLALCAALFVLVACGDDSSGTSANPDEPAFSDSDLSSSSVVRSSSSWISYSYTGPISAHPDSVANSDTTAADTATADTSLQAGDADTVVVSDTIPDTTNFSHDTDNVVFQYAKILLDGTASAIFSLDGAVANATEVNGNGVAGNAREVSLVPEPGNTMVFSTYRIKVDLEGVSLSADPSQKVSLSVIADISEGDSVVVSFFRHLQTIRALVYMDHPTFVSASDILDASMEVGADDLWRSFDTGLDFVHEDSAGATLAINAMILETLLDRGAAFLDTIAANIGTSGYWDNRAIPTVVADVMLQADATDGFAALREKLTALGVNVPSGFEGYIRYFYQQMLRIDPCTAANVNQVFSVINGYSRFAPEDESDFSTVSERFMCNADGKIVFAPDSLKDTYSFEGGEDGEVRVGAFTGNLYYTYDGGAWRPATAVEKDSYFVQVSATGDFVDIQDVYESVKPNERVIFILRHAKRGDDTSKSGTLTDDGKEQSFEVGARLSKFPEDFVLGASEFLRAHQTVEYIARGRGQQYDVRDTFPELNDDWYTDDKDANEKAKNECGGGWEVTAKYAYTGAYTTGATPAFHPLAERSVELIEDVLLKKYNDPSQRFILLSSHDKVMVPLVVYCTDKKVNLKKHDGGKWLNYLAGVAIIIDEKGNRRYIPIKSLDSAYM
ncbi:MAG: histidine phosphatase family protein [Fibrobacter sp.]|nr:histidine phosphatase family protein [Fibrobacter sp.]